MKSQELKDEIILDIKTAINHYGSLDPDYGYIHLDDNTVDHIAENVAKLAMVRNESYWTKALQLQQKRDVQYIGETMKHFAERCKEIYVQYTYPTFDKNGKAVSVFNTDGYEEIDKGIEECLKDFLKKVGVNEE